MKVTPLNNSYITRCVQYITSYYVLHLYLLFEHVLHEETESLPNIPCFSYVCVK